MKAVIVGFYPSQPQIEDQGLAQLPKGIAAIGTDELFNAGERDALCSLNPTQPHDCWYMIGYHDGLYQREIGYLHSQEAA